jgi:hypothetical protein
LQSLLKSKNRTFAETAQNQHIRDVAQSGRVRVWGGVVASSNLVIPTIFLHGADIVQKLKEFCLAFDKAAGTKLSIFFKVFCWVC